MNSPSPSQSARKLTLIPLIAATYFMVSGGPYGIEDVVQMAGYTGALLILVLTPILWSVPTAMMVGELASAIPEEGGFYIWVQRGMGNFWGFQEVWLSLAGSIFEMALYPTLFVDYLGHFAPALTTGYRGYLIGFAMIAACTWWNIRGARSVGNSSTITGILLLAPFLVLTLLGLFHKFSAAGAQVESRPLSHVDILGGILIAMWNYMGWDNASTIAGEVDRPQRNYPRAMWITVSLVALSYLLPVGGISRAGIDPNSWTTGGWVDAGRLLGGEWLAAALAIGGLLSAIGAFNALMLSFTRLPLVMAEQGVLPKIFARLHPVSGTPHVAIIVCAIGWAACLFLGFERLVILDILDHRPQRHARILGADRPSLPRAQSFAPLPGPGRPLRSDRHRPPSSSPDDRSGHSQPLRTHHLLPLLPQFRCQRPLRRASLHRSRPPPLSPHSPPPIQLETNSALPRACATPLAPLELHCHSTRRGV